MEEQAGEDANMVEAISHDLFRLCCAMREMARARTVIAHTP